MFWEGTLLHLGARFTCQGAAITAGEETSLRISKVIVSENSTGVAGSAQLCWECWKTYFWNESMT